MPVKVYDGTNWVTVAGDGAAGAPGAAGTSSSINTWVKTASGGETSLSGTGDTGYGTLAYTVGQELVFMNGTLLDRGDDYIATTGTSITGLTALTAGDVITVWTVNSFSVANTYTQAQSDARYPAKAGSVLQVLSTVKTDTFSTTSTSQVNITGLSQTITPSTTSSKVLIIVSLAAGVSNVDGNMAYFGLSGGNTATYVGDAASNRRRAVHWVRRPGDGATVAATNMPMTMVYLDSPNTTSAVTYNTTVQLHGGTAYVNRSGIDSDDGSWGRSASTITVMEIGA